MHTQIEGLGDVCVQEIVVEEAEGKGHVYEQRYGLHTWQAMAIEAALGVILYQEQKIQIIVIMFLLPVVSVGDDARS